jgi:hypothetical protein
MTADSVGRGRWAVWSAGLVVVVAAGAATAHGLYEVAVGSGTPGGIAWLYPVITDGLALVAYAATTRLAGPGRRYAWAVVVLAAGLSGLAQATYLAGSVGAAPTGLRFGVGAWPAVAAAIAAHLLFLIGAHGSPPGGTVPDAGVPSGRGPGVQWDSPERPSAGVQSVPSGDEPEQMRFAVNGGPDRRALPAGPDRGHQGVLRRALSQADRARTVAELHAARTGALPSVRELAELADVGRGTAARELAALRDRSHGLHAVPNPADQGPDQ